MKYLYLFFLFLLVTPECPNLCSGHGTCNKNGVCVCNSQPGLGINKGAFSEIIWTAADCSERMCPKGQSFTYYTKKTTEDQNQVKGTLKKLNLDNTPRLLFESDKEREMVEDTEEPTGQADVTTTAATPTTAAPTTTEPSTIPPTTPVPTTTSPPIVTQPPVTTPPPTEAPTLPPEVVSKKLDEALEGVFEKESEEVKITSYTIACYKSESGTFLGNMVVNNEKETSVGDLLEKLGVTTVDEDIYCGTIRIKKQEEAAPSTDLLSEMKEAVPKKETFVKADGRKIMTEVVNVPLKTISISDSIKKKLGLKLNTRRRMLAAGDECSDTSEEKLGKFYCIESENPAVSYYYRMKLVEVNIKCDVDSKLYNLYLKAEDMNDIQGPCFFLGDVNTPIESSEIYSFVASRGGDYYFARYNTDSTIIVAKESKESKENDETTSITLDLNYVPSLVPGSNDEYPYENRPTGEIELALVNGATIEITPYVNGEFRETYTTTVKSFNMNNLNITITSTVNNPIKPNNTADIEEGTDTDYETGANNRRRRRLLNSEDDPVYILKVLRDVGPHPFIECSGQGNCNRQTGQCECYNGFEGDACQRTSCPNNCNNNGRCVVLNEALGVSNVNDVVIKKDDEDEPFDTKLYGCICDEGHRGADCSLYECPSDLDPKDATNNSPDGEYRDCSGRGICDYTTGLCTCFDGFYGTACETTATLQ